MKEILHNQKPRESDVYLCTGYNIEKQTKIDYFLSSIDVNGREECDIYFLPKGQTPLLKFPKSHF